MTRREEAEQSLVRAALICPDEIPDDVGPDLVRTQPAARVWEWLLKVARAGETGPIDDTRAAHAAKVRVEDLLAFQCLPISVEAGIAALREMDLVESARRTFLQAASDVMTAQDIGPALEAVNAELGGLAHRPSGRTKRAHDAALALFEQLSSGSDRYLPVGIEAVEALGRWMYGSFPIIAARPGVGKTTLAIQIAYSVASQGFPVVFHSLEMPAEEIIAKMIAAEARLPITSFVEGRLPPDWMRVAADVADRVAKLPIEFAHSYELVDILATSRQAAKNGARLVIVDYLQLVQSHGSSRFETVTATSVALRRLALSETSRGNPLVVMATSQLRRAGSTEEERAPKLSDLRESGQIEQDATHVLLLHMTDPDTLRIIGAKSRFAARTSAKMRADLRHSRFLPYVASALDT